MGAAVTNDNELIAHAVDWTRRKMETGAGHDWGHIERVRNNARVLAAAEDADELVVELAAVMHDVVNLPKDHPERAQASTKSAKLAATWLDGRLEEKRIELVYEAIRCHSFSAGFTPESVEAKVVSDADNLDALGAIGIARTFEVGGATKKQTVATKDPFCEERRPDDSRYTVDHFYTKLLALRDRFYTESGRAEASERLEFMRKFLDEMARELGE